MSPLNREESSLTESTSDSEHSTMSLSSEGKHFDAISNANERRRRVRFSTVEIREHERIVGDHPDVRVGVPIALGWKHEDLEPVPLDVFERSHIKKGTYRLSSITRKNLLANVFNIPEEEIRQAEKEVQRIKEQRTSTLKRSKTSNTAEAVVQSAKRKLRRRFSKEKLLNAMAHSHSYLQMTFPTMAVA
jgi:hypothetical protein